VFVRAVAARNKPIRRELHKPVISGESSMSKLVIALATASMLMVGGIWRAEAATITDVRGLASRMDSHTATENVAYWRRHYRRAYRRGYYGYGYPYYGYGYYRPYYDYAYRPYGYYGYGWRPGITIGIEPGWGWRGWGWRY
jgi:hypothetical protein